MAKLRKELERFYQDPPDHIQVAVNERDMFEWHYLLEGPEGTPYAGGWSVAARCDPPRRTRHTSHHARIRRIRHTRTT